jgi:hypothetical protein
MPTKLTRVVAEALKDRTIDYREASKMTAAVTYDAPGGRITKADAAALKKIASLPDSTFVDKRAPAYVKSQLAELRDYAASIEALSVVKLQVSSKVPGISLTLKRDFAVVNLDERGYQHELILEVKMPSKRAEADGRLHFAYGVFEVSIDVKKGQSRESVMRKIEERLEKQQKALSINDESKDTRQFLLHRFWAEAR